MFKVNRSIIRPKYIDNKTDRKRNIARQHVREKGDEGDYPKEIKMGEILMPPYLWFNDEESTPGLNGLVGESNNPSISRIERQESTPDLRQRGLVGKYNETRATTSNQVNKQEVPTRYNQDHIHSSTHNLQPHGTRATTHRARREVRQEVVPEFRFRNKGHQRHGNVPSEV